MLRRRIRRQKRVWEIVIVVITGAICFGVGEYYNNFDSSSKNMKTKMNTKTMTIYSCLAFQQQQQYHQHQHQNQYQYQYQYQSKRYFHKKSSVSILSSPPSPRPPSIKLYNSLNLVDDQRDDDDEDEKEGSPFLSEINNGKQSVPSSLSLSSSSLYDERRGFLLAMAAVTTFLPIQSAGAVAAAQDFEKDGIISTKKSLEDLQFANGSWDRRQRSSYVNDGDDAVTIDDENLLASTGQTQNNNNNNIAMETTTAVIVPAYFTTYLTRFLINYDEGVASWWQQIQLSYSLLSNEQRQSRLGRDFGSLAVSLQQALQSYLQKAPTYRQGYEQIFERFATTYDNNNNNNNINNKEEVRRQLCLLAATLPVDQQPRDVIQKIIPTSSKSISTPKNSKQQQQKQEDTMKVAMTEDLSTLLSREYNCVISDSDNGYLSIQPSISLYQVGIGEEFGQAATATTFGPLASNALTRELPRLTFDIYALFGISGATGCALTHSIVIPLDVVKTRAQTAPESYSTINIVTDIVEKEGISGLLTGAQATLAGYAWYGISVYPSYAFFKRFFGQIVLTPDLAAAHANDIALIAGALAAVIASLGLTPLEAARIRVVTDPTRYKSLGLIGTLKTIALEGKAGGDNNNNIENESIELSSSLKSLYKGLPSLMTRQVIFGSIKFLAFERACEAIYLTWPMLKDSTWTALSVSLVAGGFSGALSCFVSQPADAVLTYVSQDDQSRTSSTDNNKGLGVLEGSRLMIEESGVSSLFRGLGSRSLWAASIISGQFLLYDIFRNFFGVNTEDLSQIYNVNL
jgi:solute carrier family 25 phosphate transporter 3